TTVDAVQSTPNPHDVVMRVRLCADCHGKPQKPSQREHQLTVAFCDENPNLSDQGIGSSELRNRERRNGELTDDEHPNPKLRNANDPARKLPNGDNATRDHWCPIGPVLERDMDQGPTSNGGVGFVLKTPTIPRYARRERCSTLGAGEGLIGNLAPAFPTGL